MVSQTWLSMQGQGVLLAHSASILVTRIWITLAVCAVFGLVLGRLDAYIDLFCRWVLGVFRGLSIWLVIWLQGVQEGDLIVFFTEFFDYRLDGWCAYWSAKLWASILDQVSMLCGFLFHQRWIFLGSPRLLDRARYLVFLDRMSHLSLLIVFTDLWTTFWLDWHRFLALFVTGLLDSASLHVDDWWTEDARNVTILTVFICIVLSVIFVIIIFVFSFTFTSRCQV